MREATYGELPIMKRLPCVAALLPVVIGACYTEEPPNAPSVTAPQQVVVGVAAPPAVAPPAPVTTPVAPPLAQGPAVTPGTAALALVIQPPTADPLAPPALSRPLAAITLPNLPHPSKYPKLPAAPFAQNVTDCGALWTGVEWVPTECLDDDSLNGAGRAARVVIPYTLMKPAATAMPPLVDHRAEGMEGPMRRQLGDQCTAFAFTAALDHAYARWTGKPGAFSVMEVWGRYHRTSEAGATEGNIGDSIGGEDDWPYDAPSASSWRPCPKPPYKAAAPGTCAQPVDRAKLSAIEANPIAEITQVEVIPRGHMDVLKEKLAAGQDVVVGIRLHSFATGGDPGAKYLVADEAGKPKEGKHGHQVLLAGYAVTPNGTYYLIHNSHGVKWGDDGYGWMHEDVLRAYAVSQDMFVVDVQPREIAKRRLRPDGALNAKCAAGMAQDSISGACAAKCADGSPRRNDVCALARNDCPAGSVNLTGSCVIAAPTSSGLDRASRVAWSCGPGGCSYDVPGGALNCRDAVCGVSCPAPVFRLATMASGLACVE
jgi:hypothetical protein